mgnify:CR=1 FL=1
MTKRKLMCAIALATAGSVWMGAASAAEKTAGMDSYELAPVNVEGERAAAETEGVFVARAGSVGFLGDKDTMETPFTTTNISQETIKSFGDPSQPLDSVLSISPSIRPVGSILHNDFQHRGFRSNGTNAFVNGVPGMFTQFNAPMYVVEKADIISGPNSGVAGTGTQYETNAAGGIINFTTKRAGAEDITRLTLTHSGQSMGGAYFDLARRFGNNKEWGARLMAEKVDGETAVDGQKVKASSIYINLDHADAKSKTNFFTGYRQNRVVGGQRWFQIGAGVTRLPRVPKASRNYAFDGMDKESYGWMMILNHEQKFSKDWKGFLNAGLLRNKLNRNVMYQYSALVINNDAGDFDLKEQTTTTPQRAGYIQMGVNGKLRTGAAEHDLTLAVDRAWRAREAARNGSAVYNLGTGNIYTGIINQTTAPTTAYQAAMNNKTTIQGISLVDAITVKKWDVLLGVHHHAANEKAYNLTTGAVTRSTDSSATTPTFALTYHPTKDISVYGSHAEYFDMGTVVTNSSSRTYANRGDVLPAAKTKQNEIGVKYANKGVLYTLSLFDIMQANNIDEQRAGLWYKVQNGEERHRGAELGITGKVAPKWTIAGALTYLRATYEKTTNGTNDGRTPDGQPQWNGTLMARYAADEKFSAFGRITYTGSAWTYNEKFKVPSNTVLDLGMTYKTKMGSVPTTFGLTLYNALNKEYWMASRSAKSLYLSTPRTLALTMSMDL